MNVIEFIRAIVRPYLAIATGTTFIGLAVYLAVKFADVELAKYVVIALVTAAVAIFSFYFGERAAKKPPVERPKE